jgi:hypothetical protein
MSVPEKYNGCMTNEKKLPIIAEFANVANTHCRSVGSNTGNRRMLQSLFINVQNVGDSSYKPYAQIKKNERQ